MSVTVAEPRHPRRLLARFRTLTKNQFQNKMGKALHGYDLS